MSRLHALHTLGENLRYVARRTFGTTVLRYSFSSQIALKPVTGFVATEYYNLGVGI